MTAHDRANVSTRGRIRATLADYFALTKPRTIHLVVGAIPAILLADRGVIALLLILTTLIGAMLMTAGANTLNCVADADIDKLMARTANRPLARAAVSTRHALVFGLAVSAVSFWWLWWTTNLLTGLLAVATIAFYVVIYTLLIKRHTSHNVVWGGAANGMPVMIGWSAVTGTIGWQAVLMFAIIFFWTPPHSWALAMRHREDYRAAGVPTLPAVATERRVANQMLKFTWLTAAATLLLTMATGWLYDAVALVAVAWLVMGARHLNARVRRGDPIHPLRVFKRSNTYLSVVFCAMAADSALELPNLLGR
jgi:protoheme IX farnesyltransferase